jgi:KDO2-lipid IV(A) lauroyltransferase
LAFLTHFTKTPWSVIVKKIRNPFLNREINELRRQAGLNPLEKNQAATRQVLKRLRENQGIAILIDQWDGPHGLWVPFFGDSTSTTSFPAKLAFKTGAAIHPAYCQRLKPGRYVIRILPEVNVHQGPDEEYRLTRELNGIFENLIRRVPEQWLWGHRRWKYRPGGLRDLLTSPERG